MKRVVRWIVASILLAHLLSPRTGAAADWPTYRGDAGRSGCTPEQLPKQLSLRWTYKARHAPRPAWSGRDTRMPFDRAYHTVVAGQTLFFGSSADGKVYALDVATGAERWTFFTGGPVRFAPAVWRGRVFVVSDDGFLYCIGAEDGKLILKLRGGPAHSMVLGNGRMISRWPARGGPAVADGVVYFGSGIWPSEGVYIYAVDAATGNVLWCNDTACSRYMLQPHHAGAKSGVSAQGYFVVAGDRLLVPTGRAVPAAFGRADGELLHFHLAKYPSYGGAAIVEAGPYFFNRSGIFDSATGRHVRKGIGPPAAAVTPQYVVYAATNEIVALDRAKLFTQAESVDRKGRSTMKTVLSSPVWRIPDPHRTTASLIVAGRAVVVGTSGRASVLDIASRKTLLTAEVDGTALGLAVAAGRLFVSTDTARIYCFGAGTGRPKALEPEPSGSYESDHGPFADAAHEIVRRTGVTEGYCLDLACGDGALAEALAKRTKLQVYAIDSDPKNVARARRRLDRAGLYGVRVTVHQGDPAQTGYPNYSANLIVSGRSATEGPGAAPANEVKRLLRPYGGVACIGRLGAMNTTVRGALAGAGSWTHQYSDPANTNCSPDTLVTGPLGMLWFNDFGFQMPSRHGRGPAPLFLNGRLFVEGVNGLLCVDAYNGRKLWKYELPGILKAYDQEHILGASGTGSNFCVTERALYLRAGSKCLRIDPASGKLLAEIEAPKQPDGKEGVWAYIACVGGTVFGTLSNTEHTVEYRYRRSDMRSLFTESILLFAMGAKTGKLKWAYRPELSIRNNSIAVGSRRVYFIDRQLAPFDRLDPKTAGPKGRRDTLPFPTGTLVALDADTGAVAWKSSENIYGTMLALSQEHDVLLMSYQDTRFKLRSELGGRMAGFRASDGKRLWDAQAKYGSRPILNGRTIYAQPGAWDLMTGKPKRFQFRRAYGCGTLAGSRHLLTYRSGTLGYTDLRRDYGTENYGGIRPGCWINAIPAGGLVLMPDATDRCTCSYLIKTSIALQPFGIRPPAISPNGGSYPKEIEVKLTADAADAHVRYTLHGSSPTMSSDRYSGPIRMSKSATLKARAFRTGSPPSIVTAASFIIDPTIISLDGSAWRVADPPGVATKSIWQVADGVATELSNIYKGAAKILDPAMDRVGTLRVYIPGKGFADGELTLDIASSDNDGLGVAFRCQAPGRYYLWAMDAQRSFRILACKNGDTYRLLVSNSNGYRSHHWYKLRVVLDGPKLTVYLDGEKDLEATDETFRTGTFALYAWGCKGAKFRNVRWKASAEE